MQGIDLCTAQTLAAASADFVEEPNNLKMEPKAPCVSAYATVVPEVYIPLHQHGLDSLHCNGGQNHGTSSSDRHAGSEQHSSRECEATRLEAREELPSPALEAEDGGDLEKEGFIPVTDLSLEQLPECIRTEQTLQTIRSIARRVVCVNNNALSAERPPEFRLGGGTALRGTGFLFFIEGDTAVVATNKHVLFNDAEVRQASIDLFYDRSFREYQAGQTRRMGRGKGLGTLRSSQKHDFTFAVFQLDADVIARLQEREDSAEDGLPTVVSWATRSFPVMMFPTRTTSSQDGSPGGSEKTVCVISHPEGAHKHVSFGRMVREDLATGAFEHDAATRHGSSGAPILVFSPTPTAVPPDSVWYHIGRQPASGHKVAHLQRNDSQLFDVNFIDDRRFDVDLLSGVLDYPKPSVDILLRWTRNMDLAKILSNLSALMRFLSLSASLGCCLHSADVAALTQWRQHAQSLVDAVTSARDAALQTPPPEPALTRDHLTSLEPCACSLLWKAVTSSPERDVKPASSGSTFLLPHSTPSNLGDFPTWPFSDGVASDRSVDAVHNNGECFLKDILTDLELQDADEADIFGYILFLLRRILHLIDYLVSLGPSVEGDSITSLKSGDRAACPPAVAEGLGEAMKRQAIESTLDLMQFGLACYNFGFAFWHVICSKFLDLHDLMMGPAPHSSSPDPEGEGSSRASCRPGLSCHQAWQGAAMADARRLLHHAHAHYGQDRQDDQETAGAGATPMLCSCSRPVPLALEEAARHLKTLVQGHTPDCAAVAKQVSDIEPSGEKAASTSSDQSTLTAASGHLPVAEALLGASIDEVITRSCLEECNEEPDVNERSEGESFVLEANTEEIKEEGNTKLRKTTKKERLFHSAKQSFEKALFRIQNSMRQYVRNSTEEEEGATRTLNGDEHYEMIMTTFPRLLGATKASLSTVIALHCLKQGQAAPGASPAEIAMSDEDLERLKDALPKTLSVLLRSFTSVEVFLHNSRLFLELSHPLLHCQCRDFAVRLWGTSSDHGTPAAGTETDRSDGSEDVTNPSTTQGSHASPRASRDGEEDTGQEDTARPASEASREDETAQGGLLKSSDDQVTSKTSAASQGGSPAADAVISAVRRVDAPGLDKETLEVICAPLASVSLQELTAEDVRPLCDVIEALDLSDLQAEDFASLCDVIRAVDLGGVSAEDIRMLSEGARSRVVEKVRREDVHAWLDLLKLLDLQRLSRSEVTLLLTLARSMAAGNSNEASEQ